MSLKYLFKIEYTDGSTFKQTKGDVSSRDPKRNAWYDVLHSGKDVKTLTLERYLERYTVDLATGNFRINGAELLAEKVVDRKTGREVAPLKRRPILFMNVAKHFNATYSNKNGALLKLTDLPEDRVYYFGWEATVGRTTHRRVLGVK